jgi:hypothetical protein
MRNLDGLRSWLRASPVGWRKSSVQVYLCRVSDRKWIAVRSAWPAHTAVIARDAGGCRLHQGEGGRSIEQIMWVLIQIRVGRAGEGISDTNCLSGDRSLAQRTYVCTYGEVLYHACILHVPGANQCRSIDAVHMQLLVLFGGTRSIDQFATGKYSTYYLAF